MLMHWRYTMLTPRFFMMDYRAAIPLFLSLFHLNQYTFGAAVVTMLVLGFIERHDLTVPAALRRLRRFFALMVNKGRRPGTPLFLKRRSIDYGC